jgi:N-acetylmuramic acid 6-phosphate etherase
LAFENMMVDLLANSQKLVERGRRTVMTATGCDYAAAGHAIEAAGKSVKVAIVMVKTGLSRAEAERRLAAADGFVRGALGESTHP